MDYVAIFYHFIPQLIKTNMIISPPQLSTIKYTHITILYKISISSASKNHNYLIKTFVAISYLTTFSFLMILLL